MLGRILSISFQNITFIALKFPNSFPDTKTAFSRKLINSNTGENHANLCLNPLNKVSKKKILLLNVYFNRNIFYFGNNILFSFKSNSIISRPLIVSGLVSKSVSGLVSKSL